MQSQRARGGGTLCLSDKDLWSALSGTVASSEPCATSSSLTPVSSTRPVKNGPTAGTINHHGKHFGKHRGGKSSPPRSVNEDGPMGGWRGKYNGGYPTPVLNGGPLPAPTSPHHGGKRHNNLAKMVSRHHQATPVHGSRPKNGPGGVNGWGGKGGWGVAPPPERHPQQGPVDVHPVRAGDDWEPPATVRDEDDKHVRKSRHGGKRARPGKVTSDGWEPPVPRS